MGSDAVPGAAKSIRPAHILGVLLLAAAFTAGCDPLTESRINNGTTAAIEVGLVLDTAKCGTGSYVQEELQDFGAADGVETLLIDTTHLSGRYRVAPSRFMVVHHGLGKKPYLCFTELSITQGDDTAVFQGDEAIREQFVRGDDYLYQFDVTSAFLAAAATSLHAANESLGQLRLGLADNEVRAIVPGEPQKGADVYRGATGAYAQEWRYPAQGITLDMMSSAARGGKVIGSITVGAPFPLKTQRGIAIGSSQAEVLRAYGKFRAQDAEDMAPSGDRFVAGSIHDGMIFTFSEGKVSAIFLGAAAE